ncbi:MAG TPA: PHB depolymerase family esterase [Caulobacteraceae bacterium]|jgi:predicted esterase
MTITSHRARFAALALLTIVASPAMAQAPPQAGQAPGVTFTAYPALARNSEMLRRMLSPLTQEIIRRRLAASRSAVAEESVDLSKERFVVDLPSHRPAAGYGLIVFVPPWDDAKVPPGWAAVLDREGFIYVSAAGSGNEQDVLTRRVPLALIAAGEVLGRYEIDPARVYVGGFSGGSRIALRIALAYPDVFRGALLDAGSDPIGVPPDILPPADLFARFQASTRVVFVTGTLDLTARASDASSSESMSRFCMFNVRTIGIPDTGHAVATPAKLTEALDSLQHDRLVDQGRLDACRAKLAGRLTAAVGEARALVAAGRGPAARSRILDLDRTFGGLAAEQIVDLADTCGCGITPGEKGSK